METDDTSTADVWARRAATVTVVWKAVWPPICGLTAVSIAVFEVVGAFLGHAISPLAISLVGVFGGFPFLRPDR